MSNNYDGLREGALSLRGTHRTLAERAFGVLHAAILSAELKPGQRLTIEDLATELEMSPMPIREALRRLDSVGLVVHVPHKGAHVTELSTADLRAIYEARLALEPLAVRRAAERFDHADEVAARTQLDRLEAVYEADASDDVVWEAHTGFHFALYRAAHSHWVERLITPLWESSERYRRATPAARRLRERRKEHHHILAACVDMDVERAGCEMYNHLARTANLLAREMGSDELFPIMDAPSRV